MGLDPVVIGSFLTVVCSVVIVGYLWYKIVQQMNKDAENRKD